MAILNRQRLLVGSLVAVTVASVLAPSVSNAITGNTVINATIGSTISLGTTSPVAFTITPTAPGVGSSASDIVTVSTNKANGYNLTLIDASADVDNNLVNGANTIAPASGSFATPAALTVNTWGYRIDGAGTFGAGPTSAQTNAASLAGTWAKVQPGSGTADTVKTTAAPAAGDTTTVWYGAMANTTKPTGVYTDTVTYTALVNP